MTDPLGNTEIWLRNSAGLATTTVDAGGHTTTDPYNAPTWPAT
jgi:hypothetical protein